MNFNRMVIVSVFLASCASTPKEANLFDIKVDFEKKSDFREQFNVWISKIDHGSKLDTEYGSSYSFDIPYYETYGALDVKKLYPKPYSNEFAATEESFSKICTSFDGQKIRAGLVDNKKYLYKEVDPSKDRYVPRHHLACKTPKGAINVMEIGYSTGKFDVTLFTPEDHQKYVKYVMAENERIRAVRKKMIEEFQSDAKPGAETNLGMIVEVKRPLASVQSKNGVKWVKIEEIIPTDLPELLSY